MDTNILDAFFLTTAGVILIGAINLQKSLGDVIGEEANIDYSSKNKNSNEINKKKNFLKKRKN